MPIYQKESDPKKQLFVSLIMSNANQKSQSCISVQTERADNAVANLTTGFSQHQNVSIDKKLNPKENGKFTYVNIKSTLSAEEHDAIVVAVIEKYNINTSYKKTAVFNRSKTPIEIVVEKPRVVTSLSSISVIATRVDITIENLKEAFGENDVKIVSISNTTNSKFAYINVTSHLLAQEHDRIMIAAFDTYNIKTKYEKTAVFNLSIAKTRHSPTEEVVSGKATSPTAEVEEVVVTKAVTKAVSKKSEAKKQIVVEEEIVALVARKPSAKNSNDKKRAEIAGKTEEEMLAILLG